MKVNITFRQQDSDEKLRQYVEQKMEKLEKYFHRPVESNVVFSIQKFRHKAEITISADQSTFAGSETSQDALSAFDLCMDKVEIQARRYRDRMKNRRGRDENIQTGAPEQAAEEDEPAGQPEIIVSDRFVPKPLSIEDAVLLMNENKDDFLVFRDAESEKVSVIYKRKDGNIGLIVPD